MVPVLVGDQDQVGFGKAAEIGQPTVGIDINMQLAKIEQQGTVADESDAQIGRCCFENIRFKTRLAIHGNSRGDEKNKNKFFAHGILPDIIGSGSFAGMFFIGFFRGPVF